MYRMDEHERIKAFLDASPEKIKLIESILRGENVVLKGNRTTENLRLLSITEAHKRLGMSYQMFRRRMQDGYFDVVVSTGRKMIRESSVIEYAKGLRKPAKEAVERHAAANKARRDAYARQKTIVICIDQLEAKKRAALGL